MSKAVKDCLPFFLLFCILTFIVKNNAFFWDTILQSSKIGQFYFDSQFKNLIVPPAFDAGHPPFFGLYLASIWKLFGKSLAISHFSVLPFLLGIVWQVYRLINYFTVEYRFLLLLLVLTNAVFLGHSTLVSPDIAFLFFFLLALNGVLYEKKWQIIIGTVGLGALSIRGIFAITSLIGISLFKDRKFRTLVIFIPAVLTTTGYFAYHFIETGWWLSTPNEGWSHHRGFVDTKAFMFNIVILAWRLVDFGNIALWIVCGMLFFKNIRVLKEPRMRLLLGIPLVILMSYAPALLLLQNPIAHRYLLPFYLLFALFIGVWLIQSGMNKKHIWIMIFLLQISGNFWVYPQKIAQGWDCSTAHLPYYHLMEEMKAYLDEEAIDYENVGTAFPNIGSRKYIDLNNELRGFPQINREEQNYILYSNVFNDFSDEAIEDLTSNWLVKKKLESAQIYVILYTKK